MPRTAMSCLVTAHELIRRVVRGEEAPEALVEFGLRIDSINGSMTVTSPTGMVVPPCPLSDLARGLLTNWAIGTKLRTWATAVLLFDEIQFIEADSQQESRLLDALWAAMVDEPIDDDALDLARQLVR
jgi:hypothetical protein